MLGTGLIGGSIGLALSRTRHRRRRLRRVGRAVAARARARRDRIDCSVAGRRGRRCGRGGRRRTRRLHRRPRDRGVRRRGHDRHRCRIGEGAGRRRCRRRPSRPRARASSAGTPWRVPSRTVSTAPTPTCSWARRGCSLLPRPPTPPRSPRCARSWVCSAPRRSRWSPRSTTCSSRSVSHVPQLAASTLMDVATARGGEHRTLLRLAAGGFRDMTRIAAGHPGIWPDILAANRDAVLRALDDYRDALRCGARADRRGRPAGHARPVGAGARRSAEPAGRYATRGRAGRAAHPGSRPPGCARRDHDARRAPGCQRVRPRDRATPARAAPACSCSSPRPPAPTCSRRAWKRSGTTSPGERSHDGFRSGRRRRATAAGPATGSGRQVDLAPRAAVRRACRREEHARASGDGCRRRRDATRARAPRCEGDRGAATG